MADQKSNANTPSKSATRGVFGDPFGNLFEGFFRPMARFDDGATQPPAVDVRETDDAYVIHADLPGIKKQDIKVEVHEGVLTISGESSEESEKKEDGQVLRRERRYGSYRRDMRLGSEIQEAGIKAKYNDGVLEVTVPKAPDAPQRTIKVEVS